MTQMALVIDLDTCVGCQACVTSCKEWNTSGHMAPLTDINPYGAQADGVWFNRVHTYKRAADGIVLVDEDKCIGCQLCSWACPYGARELDPVVGVMKKCTLCIDR